MQREDKGIVSSQKKWLRPDARAKTRKWYIQLPLKAANGKAMRYMPAA